MDIFQILTIALSSLAIISYIIRGYKDISEPNNKQDKKIVEMETQINLMMTNHLPHIEKDIKDINNNIKDICSDMGLIKGIISKK